MHTISVNATGDSPDNKRIVATLVNAAFEAVEEGSSKHCRRILVVHDGPMFRSEHHTHWRLDLTVIANYRKVSA